MLHEAGGWELGTWACFFHSLHLGISGLPRQLDLVRKELCPWSLTDAGVESRVGEAWCSLQSLSLPLFLTMFAVAPTYPSLWLLSKVPPESLSSTPLLQEWLDSSEGT